MTETNEQRRPLAPVIEKHYELVRWMISKINQFPRDQRFLLADRIEEHLLDVLELLIAAMYSSDRRAILIKVNLKLDVLRMLMRLAKDLKYVNIKAYDFFCMSLVEIGRMVGGWRNGCCLLIDEMKQMIYARHYYHE